VPAIAGVNALVPLVGALLSTTENRNNVPQSSEPAIGAVQLKEPPDALNVQLFVISRSPSLKWLETTITPLGSGTLNFLKPLLLMTRRFGEVPATVPRAKS